MQNEWSTIDSIRITSQDWRIVPLQEFSSSDKNSFVNGPFGSDLLSSELVDEGHPVIYIRDIKDGRYQRKSEVCVTSEKHHALPACHVDYGDVVIAKVGDPPCEAAVYNANESGVVTQDVIRIKTVELGLSQFLVFLLNSDIGKRQVKKIKIAGTRERVSLTDFKKLKFPFPPVSEQKKIAKILSTWDKAITNTEQLLANSQQQKMALMQQLLTGKKRLLDSNGVRFSGEWITIPLEKICHINPKRPPEPKDGLVSFIPMEFVSEDAKLLSTSERFYTEVSKGFTSFLDGDTLIAKITPCFENGKGCYVQGMKNGIGFGSTEFHVLRANKLSSPLYLYYMTNTSEFRIKGEANMQGSAGQKRVTTDYLKSLKVTVPKQVEEQQKIAAVLSTADQEISTLQQKLAALKQEKKALMQQLLTGKRRVKVEAAA
ncbi:restriction endonuclease subunit S [Aeromonas veronii]|uniref:restriction endonuclease subunit S n=1 Tax=Aeromonas veronii TaxID=654 RepID=UPI0022455920|nr:restriction endonuclease subunit S [Aeromonas veronii]MCX0432010.1 restriction endonuclease subunit S [Aeromonas veronii]